MGTFYSNLDEEGDADDSNNNHHSLNTESDTVQKCFMSIAAFNPQDNPV